MATDDLHRPPLAAAQLADYLLGVNSDLSDVSLSGYVRRACEGAGSAHNPGNTNLRSLSKAMHDSGREQKVVEAPTGGPSPYYMQDDVQFSFGKSRPRSTKVASQQSLNRLTRRFAASDRN